MKFFDWWIENIWTILFALYFLTSVLDLTDIMFSVKHTDTETKVSIERPIEKEKQKTSDSPRTEEGPKATW